MSRVVVLGSINVDLVVRVSRLPGPGETVLGEGFERHFGGKGANQAVAAARAGATVSMIGAVGNDEHGDASLAALAVEGIDLSAVRRVSAATGVALIAVAPDGENQIVVAPGANRLVSAEAVSEVPLSASDVVLACLEVPMDAVLRAAEAAGRTGARLVVNPAPGQPLPASLLAGDPILTPNQGELLAVSGAATRESALEVLTLAGVSTLIVTRGPAGALLVQRGRQTSIPGLQVTAVDATGAGDAFSGVLAAWLAAGESVEEAAIAANVAAALSVTRAGAREGMPARAEILAAIGS